jgi:DNA-binding IscR family transcriptional regulator
VVKVVKELQHLGYLDTTRGRDGGFALATPPHRIRIASNRTPVSGDTCWCRDRQFYSLRNLWVRSRCVQSLKSRIAFVLISKLYRQMYANTGIATDSARVGSARWARRIAHPCRRLFTARPMPDLSVPA